MTEKAKDLRLGRTNAHIFHREHRDEILEAIRPVFEEEYWNSWRIEERFEREFAETMGYPYASGVQSGSAGLRLCLEALGLTPGDEVITVANSDIATTAAISQCGGKIVFCDIDQRDFCINVDLIESRITEKTRGIIAVDMYGLLADGMAIREIADRHGLFYIDDATLSLGGIDNGKSVGSFADAAVFSTCPYKPFESIAGGGIVVTANQELHDRIELLKGFGQKMNKDGTLPVRYDHIVEGYNLKMTPVEAAVLLVKLPYLKEWSLRRHQIGLEYIRRFSSCKSITIPEIRKGSVPIFRMFPMLAENRDGLYDVLRKAGIHASLHYIPPVHKQTVYRNANLPGSDMLPVTEQISEKILCLPSDPLMREEDIDYICDVVINFIKG